MSLNKTSLLGLLSVF